jgi:hypothetical protein
MNNAMRPYVWRINEQEILNEKKIIAIKNNEILTILMNIQFSMANWLINKS